MFTPELRNIKIRDPLFGLYADRIVETLLPYQWEVMNDRIPGAEKSHCIENFRIAAGEISGRHRGAVFCDTDAYKWLETLSYCLESGRGFQYVKLADGLIDLIAKAQEADGYLNTYFSVNHPEKKWTNLAEGHELYSAGHLIEAAVAYYRATGKEKILDVACRLADLICSLFGDGPEQHRGYPGHQEIELALIKLWHVTGKKTYMETARYFLAIRGGKPNYLLEELRSQGADRIFPEFADYDDRYAQSHLPPVEQTTAEGHAVRAMYMYSAMADLARETKDRDLQSACLALWDNITQKRMYITGGIGSSSHLERFTADYDLPNDRMYCESCASIGLMMFGQRMTMLTGDARYYDVVERALCNTVLAGIAVEGDRYFYVNPLEVWPDNCLPGTSMAHVKPVRQPWFACACCPPNIARTIASIGQYIFAQDEESVFINQFISSELTAVLKDTQVKIGLSSSLWEDGEAQLTIETDKDLSFMVRLRIPKYLEEPHFELDGKAVIPDVVNGYAVFALSCSGMLTLRIRGRITPRWEAADPNVRADAGRVALCYGPFVYCLEQTDNGTHLSNLYVTPEAQIRTEQPDARLPDVLPFLRFPGWRLHSGVEGLYGKPKFSFTEETLTAIPYCFWCTRDPGEMLVWLKARI